MATCAVCNNSRTWYVAKGKEYCKDHKQNAVDALKPKFSTKSQRREADSPTRPRGLRLDYYNPERLD